MPDGVEVLRAVRCNSHGADASGPWWCVTFKLSEQRVNQLFPDQNVAGVYKEYAKVSGSWWAKPVFKRSGQHGYWEHENCVPMIFAARGDTSPSTARDRIVDLRAPSPDVGLPGL